MHLPEEMGLFQSKTSGALTKFKNHPRRLVRPTPIHTYQPKLNPSGDPVPLRNEDAGAFHPCMCFVFKGGKYLLSVTRDCLLMGEAQENRIAV
jgi:hypothetical protein